LPAKGDVAAYFKNEVITRQQHQQYFNKKEQEAETESEGMALNLLNTTGTDRLANYNAI
jgi:hypothetical protein